MNRVQRYLQESEYTKIGPGVKAAAAKVMESSEDVFLTIDNFMFETLSKGKHNNKIFRKRTSEDILKNGYYTGCSDVAILFASISRALGIPSKFVETFRDDWLENPEGKVMGHVYVDVFYEGSWKTYDPLHGFAKSDERGFIKARAPEKRYVKVASGLDHTKLYRSDNGELIRLSNTDDMRKFAKEFN